MHVAFGFDALGGDALAQGLHQWDGGIAGRGDGQGQRGMVVEVGLAGSLDGRHGFSGNQPHARLGARQGGLEIQHALHPPLVAEDRAHGGLGEVGIEELVARAVQASAPECGMVFRMPIIVGVNASRNVGWVERSETHAVLH
ncbi:hypothetical protein FQZ97_1076450 [compost metagenome]